MRTFVLIPGVGCGGWAWRPTAKLLEQAGHRAAALTLPGLRFDTPDPAATLREAVQYVVDHVQTHSPEAVTLVAHSWGGYPATAAAAALGPAQVEELVYYNAVVPASGVPMVDENTQMGAYLRHTLTHAQWVCPGDRRRAGGNARDLGRGELGPRRPLAGHPQRMLDVPIRQPLAVGIGRDQRELPVDDTRSVGGAWARHQRHPVRHSVRTNCPAYAESVALSNCPQAQCSNFEP